MTLEEKIQRAIEIASVLDDLLAHYEGGEGK